MLEESCQQNERSRQYPVIRHPLASENLAVSRSRAKLVPDPIRTLFVAGTAAGMTDRQLLERFIAGRGEGAEAAFAALIDATVPWS